MIGEKYKPQENLAEESGARNNVGVEDIIWKDILLEHLMYAETVRNWIQVQLLRENREVFLLHYGFYSKLNVINFCIQHSFNVWLLRASLSKDGCIITDFFCYSCIIYVFPRLEENYYFFNLLKHTVKRF